ncbi:hypothetical protein [Streptomyces misionensis]|uniref:hypothetical protein n=1 Tax=Streptomyces misionensis TaxID=67331 RepID=UPI0036AA5B21
MTTHHEQTNEPTTLRTRPRGSRAARFQCYFCGGQSVIRSEHDNEHDTGRLELYCDNEHCAAKEIAVIVCRDGYAAGERADLRALAAIDEGLLDMANIPGGSKPAPSPTFKRPDEEQEKIVAARRDQREWE